MSKKRVSAKGHPAHSGIIKQKGFIGVALGGGKSDKTCLAYVEYFPEQNKIFLSQILTKLKSEDEISSDLILIDEIVSRKKSLVSVAFNVALSWPKCVRCKLKCPGYEVCDEEEILWLWDYHRKLDTLKKDRRIFTPYTDRCAEYYVRAHVDDSLHAQAALGANMAPLTARAHFLTRRLSVKTLEVFPRLSLWRIGNALHIRKSHLTFHKHQSGGAESRRVILNELAKQEISFFYEQDFRLLCENGDAFDAYICAITAVLKYKNQCEAKPKDFPKEEGWIEIPKANVVW